MASKLSLLVVLRPAVGRLQNLGPISQTNLAQSRPSAAAVRQAEAFFSAQGYTIHSGPANSFSIEAGSRELAKMFHPAELKQLQATGGDLKLDKLPRDIRELLESVCYSRPPDFGPKSFE